MLSSLRSSCGSVPRVRPLLTALAWSCGQYARLLGRTSTRQEVGGVVVGSDIDDDGGRTMYRFKSHGKRQQCGTMWRPFWFCALRPKLPCQIHTGSAFVVPEPSSAISNRAKAASKSVFRLYFDLGRSGSLSAGNCLYLRIRARMIMSLGGGRSLK